MTFSMVDHSMPSQSCPYPLSVEVAVFNALALCCPDRQWFELFSLYIEGRVDGGEAMIDWALHNNIVFDCPVCGNTGKRQVWIELNESSRTLCSVPCYCQNAAPAPCDCAGGVSIPI